MTTNGSRGGQNGTKPQNPRGSLIDLGKDVMNGFAADIDRAMEESTAIREAEAKFGSPGAAGIEVRREGLRQRENPEDRKRKNALKANRDRKVLSAHHLNDLGGLVVTGEKFVLDVAEHLSDVTDNLPDHLQPLGQTLTKAGVQILSGALIELVKFNAEMGFLEITEATKPGQHRQ
jgi:DUF1680 family protein